jgi:hypothetical protein
MEALIITRAAIQSDCAIASDSLAWIKAGRRGVWQYSHTTLHTYLTKAGMDHFAISA